MAKYSDYRVTKEIINNVNEEITNLTYNVGDVVAGTPTANQVAFFIDGNTISGSGLLICNPSHGEVSVSGILEVNGDPVSTESHDHDDTYYTESEIGSFLSAKADISHSHNDTYYTETEVDGKLETLTTGDHGTASSPQVVNVVYGTGDPPTASTTTEGTLWVKYTA